MYLSLIMLFLLTFPTYFVLVEVKIEELKEVQPGLQEDDLSSISDETYFDNGIIIILHYILL